MSNQRETVNERRKTTWLISISLPDPVVFEVFRSAEFDDMHPRGTFCISRCGHKPTGHYF